jgi:cell division protein FtsW
MDNILKRYFKGDYVIWVIYILLVMLSVAVFFSASSQFVVDTKSTMLLVTEHIGFLLLGFAALMIIYSIPKQYLKFFSWALLFFSIILVIYAFWQGRRWIFGFQPSELAKFALIIVAADLIDRFQNPDYLQKNFKWFCAAIWLPLVFITPLNGSTGLIIMLPILVMMIIGSIPWKKIGIFIGVPLAFLAVCCVIAISIPSDVYEKYKDNDAKPYVVKMAVNSFDKIRIHTWINRLKSPSMANLLKNAKTDEEISVILNNNTQKIAAQCAIYDGKSGVLPGNSIWRNSLSEAQSDYIFSIIVEEYGIYGAIFVILLFLWLLWRTGILVRKSETIFSAIVIVGAASVIIFQAFIHIQTCTDLFFHTGQTLPLISAGGTSIVVMSAFFGLLLGMSRQVEKTENEEVIEKNSVIENDKFEEILGEKIEIVEQKNNENVIEISENDEIAKTSEINIF